MNDQELRLECVKIAAARVDSVDDIIATATELYCFIQRRGGFSTATFSAPDRDDLLAEREVQGAGNAVYLSGGSTAS